MTSRRQFLVSALAGASGLLAQQAFANQKFLFQEPKSATDEFDCIVIGAGMSGISAARDIAFPAFTKRRKVVVLESSHRIGGRIHTLHDPRFGGPIEMGGTFLHVAPETFVIGQDIKKYNIKIKKIPRIFSGLIYSEGWESDLRKEYEMMFEWKWSQLLTFASDINSYRGPDMSAREWLKLKQYPRLGRSMVDLYFTGHAPGNLDQLSLRGFALDKYSEVEMHGSEYAFPDGYDQFLHQMTFGKEHHHGHKLDIRFGQAVRLIKYRPNGVEVTTATGEVYKAKSAVITVSVGVLKSGTIQFDPPLPEDKMEALKYLEMGDEAKMVLKFKKRFWNEGVVFFNRIDKNHEMCRTYHAPFGDNEEKNKVFSALFAGDEADKIRNMSDEEVIRALCRDFDKMFPHAAPTYELLDYADGAPIYQRYQWSLDQNTLGADSYLKYTGNKYAPIDTARRKLSRPYSTPSLFWAGEATATGEGIHPGCTHGAHFSGARAALEVGEFLRKRACPS